jgi:quercetin dioxygenase-like cupin family protein
MRITPSLFAIASVCSAYLCSTALAELAKEHTVITSEEIKWEAGPAALPLGAESVVLYGDPSKEGLFAMRLKLPKGYHIPPHTHPQPEIVTVISGGTRLGMGETADEAKTQILHNGSFIAMSPGTAHYVYVEEETTVQLNSIGPWEVKYIDPKDDPRKTTQ